MTISLVVMTISLVVMTISTTPNAADDWVCYWYEVFVKSVSNHNVVIGSVLLIFNDRTPNFLFVLPFHVLITFHVVSILFLEFKIILS
jgi:hypothetical protein